MKNYTNPKVNKGIYTILIVLICISACQGTQIQFQSHQGTIGDSSIYFWNKAGDHITLQVRQLSGDLQGFYIYLLDATGKNSAADYQTLLQQSDQQQSSLTTYYQNAQQGLKVFIAIPSFAQYLFTIRMTVKLNNVQIMSRQFTQCLNYFPRLLLIEISVTASCQLGLYWNGPSATIKYFSNSNIDTYTQLQKNGQGKYLINIGSSGKYYVGIVHGIIGLQNLKNITARLTTQTLNSCSNVCFQKDSRSQLVPGATDLCMCNPQFNTVYNSVTGKCECVTSDCRYPSATPSSKCGNNKFQSGQQCDNGNKTGCLNCQLQAGFNCISNPYSSSLCYEVCGDGILTANQKCDNKNKPGCVDCQIVSGYSCTGSFGSASDCQIKCGDGVVGANQKCDTGGQPGCNSKCQVEAGYVCTNKLGKTSVCTSICGDNIRTAGQKCDNGRRPGCATCTAFDTGYTCTGEVGFPSICSGICGDSIRVATESCDNGNALGCSTKCKPDSGYICSSTIGAKSSCSTSCGDYIKAGSEECDNGDRLGCKGCIKDPKYTCVQSPNGSSSICRL